MSQEEKKDVKITIGIVVWIIFLVLFFGCFTTIDSTERWVVRRWWAVDRKLWEWFHVVVPIMEKVKKYSIVPQRMEMHIGVWEQWAITKDNQTIGADLTIFYRFDDQDIINIAKNYWTDVLEWNLKQNVLKAFKESIWKLTIFDVAESQAEIWVSTLDLARKYINNYPMTIDDIQITNYDWSEEFDKSIQETMKIAQEVKQQEEQLKKVEMEAQQAVKIAEANRDAEKLNAEALKIKWEWEKAYNDSITAKQVNMEYQIRMKELEIEELRVKKWNWQYVPTNNYWPIPVEYGSVQWQ